MKRKFIGLIAFALIFTIVGQAYAYEIPEDVKGTSYQKVVEVLTALDIFQVEDDGFFYPDDAIIREEFAMIIVKMLGLTDTMQGAMSSTKFSDVDEYAWSVGGINLAVQAGIINGYDDGRFGPQDNVTYNQAVKMLVCTLGFDFYAKEKGGYPFGYLQVAAEKGITKNVIGESDKPIKRGMLAQLVYNCLDVDIMQQVSYGKEIKYSVEKGKTLLSERLKIEKNVGIIDATSDTDFLGNSGINDEEVRIDGYLYKTAKTNAKDFLGYRVTYYAKHVKDSDVRELLYISADQGKNDVLSIDADNISKNTTKQKLFYWNDKEKEVKEKIADISSAAIMIFNGKAKPSFVALDLMPMCGKIVLIDNNNDGIYDFINVTSYINYIVNSVNVSGKIIYGQCNFPDLNLNDPNKKFAITMLDGSLVEINNIKKWNILSVAADREIINNLGEKSIDVENSEIFKIRFCKEKIIGKIDGKDDNKVTIEGKEYKLSPSLIQLIDANKVQSLEVGSDASYYLDVEGRIAAVDFNEKDYEQYGYLLNAMSKVGIVKNIELEVFNSKGSMVILTCRDKIKFDGESNVRSDEIFKRLLQNGKVKPQLIGYLLDQQGNVIMVDTANFVEKYEAKDNSLQEGQNYIGAMYKGDSRTFNNMSFFLSPAVIVFKLPDASKLTTGTAVDEDYLIKGLGYFSTDYTYDIQPYNLSITNGTKLVVYYPRAGQDETASGSGITLVDRINQTINANGEPVPKLIGMSEGKIIKYAFKSYDVLAKVGLIDSATGSVKLSRGDIVQIKLNDNKEIVNIIKKLDIKTQSAFFADADTGSSSRMAFGSVYSKEDNSILVNTQINKADTINVFNLLKNIMLYDEETDEISLGTVGDIRDFYSSQSRYDTSLVFLNTTWTGLRSMVIYKLKNTSIDRFNNCKFDK